MKSGLKRGKSDHRTYSFNRTFGIVGVPTDLPKEYSVDAGFGFPDQNADGLPYGCTGYTQAELASDEDAVKYNPKYTYDKSRIMAGVENQNVGVELKTALKSTIVYGVQHGAESDQDALQHRRGAYYAVEPVGDSFDGIRTALWINRNEKRAVSIGIPWFPEFEYAMPPNGIMPIPTTSVKNASWHNAKCVGWHNININGVPYLCLKSWQGANYGDHGWCYMSRELCNQIFAIRGTEAYTLAKATPETIQTVKLTILQTILSYMRMILKIMVKQTMA